MGISYIYASAQMLTKLQLLIFLPTFRHDDVIHDSIHTNIYWLGHIPMVHMYTEFDNDTFLRSWLTMKNSWFHWYMNKKADLTSHCDVIADAIMKKYTKFFVKVSPEVEYVIQIIKSIPCIFNFWSLL